MKTIIKLLLITSLLTIYACDNSTDEQVVTPNDFSIESDDQFFITAYYSNGWVKEAYQLDISGEVSSTFEYFENGLIQSYTDYYLYPQYSIRREIKRNKDGLPVSSVYYNDKAELIYKVEYDAQGLKSFKEIIEPGLSHTKIYFEGGDFSSASYKNEKDKLLLEYQKSGTEVNLRILENDQLLSEKVYPVTELLGKGFHSSMDLPMPNNFLDNEKNETYLNSTLSTSLIEKPQFSEDNNPFRFELDNSFRLAFQERLGFDSYNSFPIEKIIFDDHFREFSEEYPTSSSMMKSFVSSYDHVNFSVFVNNMYNNSLDKTLPLAIFESTYGNLFTEAVAYGKLYLLVVNVSNLPSDESLKNELTDLAIKKTNHITTGTEALTKEEEALLGKIFYQLKIYSAVNNQFRGKQIFNDQEYKAFLTKFESAEFYPLDYKFRETKTLL